MYRAEDSARAPCPGIVERNVGQPVAPTERYHHIDVIRGLALFGVLLVNELSMFRIPLLEHIRGRDASQSSIDAFTLNVVAVALEFKAVTIFSFLFGAGVAIQAERARANNAGSAAFLARRFGWLLIFGVSHMLLIWNGDILALYGVCGLLLLPALWLPRTVLWLVGALLIAIPEVVLLPLHLPVNEIAQAHIARAREIYSGGDFASILRFRVFEARLLILPLLAGILPRTIGLMLWGIAGWRSGIFRKPDEHKRALSVTFVSAGVAAMVFPHVPIVLAAAYVSGLLLIVPLVRPSRLRGVAAVGQMAR
jgi:uncharacterized protein